MSKVPILMCLMLAGGALVAVPAQAEAAKKSTHRIRLADKRIAMVRGKALLIERKAARPGTYRTADGRRFRVRAKGIIDPNWHDGKAIIDPNWRAPAKGIIDPNWKGGVPVRVLELVDGRTIKIRGARCWPKRAIRRRACSA